MAGKRRRPPVPRWRPWRDPVMGVIALVLLVPEGMRRILLLGDIPLGVFFAVLGLLVFRYGIKQLTRYRALRRDPDLFYTVRMFRQALGELETLPTRYAGPDHLVFTRFGHRLPFHRCDYLYRTTLDELERVDEELEECGTATAVREMFSIHTDDFAVYHMTQGAQLRTNRRGGLTVVTTQMLLRLPLFVYRRWRADRAGLTHARAADLREVCVQLAEARPIPSPGLIPPSEAHE